MCLVLEDYVTRIWLELRRLPQILFYVEVARMVIFKSRNQLQKATRRKVTMLL